MQRILMLDTGKEWGGGTNSLLELLRRVDRSRFEITACFYHDYGRGRGSQISHELAALGVPFIRLQDLRQPLWAKLAKELARGLLGWHYGLRARAVFAVEMGWRIRPRASQLAHLLRDGGFDLIYLNNQPSSNLEGYLAGRMAAVPIVQHCRIAATLNATEVATANATAHAVICVSQGVADSLRKQGVDAAKLIVVHNAIDGGQSLPRPQPLPAVPAGAPVIGTVGQLVKRKSVDDLLRAAAKVGAGNTAAHVLIIGAGPEEQSLHELAGSLGIAERVHFVGFRAQPLPWLAAMDIFILASSREGLPRVILEAMLLGKPVVAAHAIGSSELVVNGETGYLYAHGDVAALAARIGELAADPALRRRMGEHGRQRVLAGFSIENYVAGVERVLASAGSSA